MLSHFGTILPQSLYDYLSFQNIRQPATDSASSRLSVLPLYNTYLERCECNLRPDYKSMILRCCGLLDYWTEVGGSFGTEIAFG